MLFALKPIKWLIKAIFMTVGFAVIYWMVIFGIVWHASTEDDRRASDAIIVMGAAQYDGRPSPDLQGLLDHALELWRAKIAPVIVVTGGKQPLDRFTEADAGARYLHARGVADKFILREVQGRSSWESLHASARFLKAGHRVKVTLVSDAYHAARIIDVGEEAGLSAVSSPSRLIHGSRQVPYLLRESVRVAAGRIFGYDLLERHHRVGNLVPGLASIVMLPSRVSPRRRRPNRG